MKTKITIIIAISLLLFTNSSLLINAQITPATGDGFVQGNLVEIGIDGDCGVMGSSDAAPVGYHPTNGGLGFVANPGMDGWASQCGDYFLPGSPYFEWSLSFNGNDFQNDGRNGGCDITGANTNNVQPADNNGLGQNCWEASQDGLDITQITTVGENDLFFVQTIYLCNTTGTDMTEVYYSVTFDPDNDVPQGGLFSTTNTNVSQGPGTPAEVTAVGLGAGCFLSLNSGGATNAVVGHGDGAFDDDGAVTAEDFYNQTPLNIDFTPGATATADDGIGIAYYYPFIAPGSCVSFPIIYELADGITPTPPAVIYIPGEDGNPDTPDLEFCVGSTTETPILEGFTADEIAAGEYRFCSGIDPGDGASVDPVTGIISGGSSSYCVEFVYDSDDDGAIDICTDKIASVLVNFFTCGNNIDICEGGAVNIGLVAACSPCDDIVCTDPCAPCAADAPLGTADPINIISDNIDYFGYDDVAGPCDPSGGGDACGNDPATVPEFNCTPSLSIEVPPIDDLLADLPVCAQNIGYSLSGSVAGGGFASEVFLQITPPGGSPTVYQPSTSCGSDIFNILSGTGSPVGTWLIEIADVYNDGGANADGNLAITISLTYDLPILSLVPPPNPIITWYDTPGGTVQGSGNPFLPTATDAEEGAFDVNTPGTYTYYASCTCEGVETSIDAFTYTVWPEVTASVANVNACSIELLVDPTYSIAWSANDNVLGAASGDETSAAMTATATGYIWDATAAYVGATTLGDVTFTITNPAAPAIDAACQEIVLGPLDYVCCTDPSISINASSACVGEAATLSVTEEVAGTGAIATYLWDDNGTGLLSSTTIANPTFSTATAGTYPLSVEVMTADGCGATATGSITIYEVPIITMSSTDPLCNGGSDGSATAGTDGLFSPYTYLWSDGQTTATAIGLNAGVYTVEVTDANGCSNSATINITEPSQMVCDAIINDALCAGEDSGSGIAFISGGVGGYTYDWLDAGGVSQGTADNIDGLAPGDYTLEATDLNGCICTFDFSITEPLALSITCGGNSLEGSLGSISPFWYNTHTITIEGGSSPYDIDMEHAGYVTWSIAQGSGSATVSINYADNAEWCISVIDGNACTTGAASFDCCNDDGTDMGDNNSIDGANGNILDIEGVVITGESGVNADDGAIGIEISGCEDADGPSYEWSGPNGYSSTDPAAMGIGSGLYYVTVTCDGEATTGWYWVPLSRSGGRLKNGGDVNEVAIEVYPNPFTDYTNIDFELNESMKIKVEVFSIDGKRMKLLFDGKAEGGMLHNLPIYRSELAGAGTYTCIISTEKGDVFYKKFVLVD